MACHCANCPFSPSRSRNFPVFNSRSPTSKKKVQISCINKSRSSYNTLVSEAVRLLGPPARFEPSKLEVVLMGEVMNKYAGVTPRTYILSHCDFTANLTLTISSVINLDQLKGWYKEDDVVAEWKKRKGELCLHIHCYVGGLPDLAAEFRYHIFSKEMPLVLKAVLHGDSELFKEHPEVLDALVWVYFHSSVPKYNRVECWGPLKNAVEGRQGDQIQDLLAAADDTSRSAVKGGSPRSLFQALFAFLL